LGLADYHFNVFGQRKYLKKLRDIHRNPVKRGLAPSGAVAMEQLW
jgi:hypothetical protein